MEIKVTIALDEKAHNVLNRLLEALGTRIQASCTTAATPANDDGEWTEEEMQEAMKQIAEEEAEARAAEAAKLGLDATKGKGGQVADESAGEAPAPISAPVPAKKGKPHITVEQLRALAADVKTKTGSVDGVKKLLTEYGVKNISGVPEDKMDEFAAKLKELL